MKINGNKKENIVFDAEQERQRSLGEKIESVPKESDASERNIRQFVKKDRVQQNVGEKQGDTQPKKKKKKWIIIALLGVVFCTLLGISVWGYSLYDRVSTDVSIANLLPKEADTVIRVVIKEDSEQVRLLKDLFQRFPGYSYIRKELDTVGEGKDADESFLEVWNSFGLNFEEDIFPAIGEYAWVSIPDFTPVEKVFGRQISQVFDLYQEREFAINLPQERAARVLGKEEKWGYISKDQERESDQIEEVDYIMGVEVEDKKKLQEVIEKMSQESDQFEYEKRKYSSYPYYVLSLKEEQEEQGVKGYDLPLTLRLNETFSALIGSSWVVSSREEWILEAIRRHASHTLISFTPQEKSSLNDNENYREIMNRFGDKEELISLYYDIDTKGICGSDELCNQIFSAQAISQGSGFSIQLSEKGIQLYTENILDEEQFSQQKNAFDGGISLHIPKQSGKYWADIFGEVSDAKHAYYDSKKYLTSQEERGYLEENIDEIYKATGIHWERDFVDKIQGDLGFSVFSEKRSFPIGMLTVEMENGSDFVQALMRYFIGIQEEQYEAYASLCEGQSSDPFCASLEKPNFELIQEDLPAGRLLRVEGGKDPLLGIVDIGLCAGLSNDKENRVFIASSCLPIRTVFDSESAPKENVLAFNEEYQISKSYVGEEGYSRSHIVPLGVFYSVYGIYHTLMNTMGGYESDSEISQENDFLNDPIFVGIEGVMKTIPSITSQSKNRGSSTTFIHIKEIPKEEKERTEAGIEMMMSGLTNARASAEQSRFKSTVSSYVPEMILCCDGGEQLYESPNSKSLLCGSQDMQFTSAEELGFDFVEYKVMQNCSIDNLSFEIHINTKGAGICSGTTILTEVGVEKFPQGC